MPNYLVWIDGIMDRDEGFIVSAKGYKSAIRQAVKLHKQEIAMHLSYLNLPELPRLWFHVEKGSGTKRNRYMYIVTLGKKLGIKNIE
jgi:hypothetical protein